MDIKPLFNNIELENCPFEFRYIFTLNEVSAKVSNKNPILQKLYDEVYIDVKILHTDKFIAIRPYKPISRIIQPSII